MEKYYRFNYVIHLSYILLISVSCKKESAIEPALFFAKGNIDINRASLNLHVMKNGCSTITEQGICWKLSAAPTIFDVTQKANKDTNI